MECPFPGPLGQSAPFEGHCVMAYMESVCLNYFFMESPLFSLKVFHLLPTQMFTRPSFHWSIPFIPPSTPSSICPIIWTPYWSSSLFLAFRCKHAKRSWDLIPPFWPTHLWNLLSLALLPPVRPSHLSAPIRKLHLMLCGGDSHSSSATWWLCGLGQVT